MFIYIDESGSFSYPKEKRHSYACAGALTIPERRHGSVLKSFKTLRRKWGMLGHEVKGRDLDEGQVNQIINLLINNDAKFHACVVDLLHHPPESIAWFKNEQSRRLLSNVTDKHHPNVVQSLKDAGEKMRSLSDQLFLQFCVMTEVVNAQLHDSMIYFAINSPTELGKFRWVVDRKGQEKTTYEDLWLRLLTPFIHGRQFGDEFENKIVCVTGGNYEYCKRFFGTIEKWPEHLPEQSPGLREKTHIETTDLKLILKESFTLKNSAEVEGLQLADIVTNSLRRAIVGNLQDHGWKDLGKMLFRWKNRSIRLVRFAAESEDSLKIEDDRVAKVISSLTHNAYTVI